MVNQNLYDAPYIKQFTDMPILVRRDNGKFLRVSDDPTSPDYNKYYMWDNTSNSAVLAPGTQGTPGTLDLLNVALEGDFTTVEGVNVAPVFQHLTEKLADYSPAAVSDITGISSAMITQLAQEFAATKPARIIEGAGTNHYYHNDLINRAQILLVALTGNVGKPGGGFDHYVGQEKLWAEEGFFDLSFPIGRPKQRFQNTTLWTYVHANVTSDVDSLWPRSIQSYIQDSVNNGWMPLYPTGPLDPDHPDYRSPKMMFIWGANYLNQAKGFQDVITNLWPKLDLIVSINQRMDTTSLYADVILPAASMFEKWDISTTDLHTYVHPFTPVLPTQFDSKTDWQIFRELAGALQATGYSFDDTVPDGTTITRDFSTLQADFDDDGHGGSLANDRDVAQFLLDHSPETSGLTIQSDTGDDSIIEHPRRFLTTNPEWTSDIIDGVAYYGFQRMYDYKRPLTTQTGRQQFYIDHDWFLPEALGGEFGEQLPVHKGPIDIDAYPLRWVTPHGRWSIHTSWRDSTFQLRHQRGRPIVYLSEAEATDRGLRDNDLVRVFNGHGSMQAHLCISNRMPGELALMYHGWETYTMNDNYQSPTNIRIKPTQLIGMKQGGVKYGHVNFRLNYWGATGNQKDTRVQIEKGV
jgi:complex iron-sulfur molybdoenzyme family reductase subunit alpha